MSDPLTPSDSELLRQHVAGDPDAFATLVRRHQDRMWAVALRTLGNPTDAADALQDALLAAWRRAESFRGDAKVTTWLHRIVVNACLDRVRRAQVRAVEPLSEHEERLSRHSAGPAYDDPAERQERRSAILAALQQISAEQRLAIVLVDIEGYSVDEAAAVLQCAPGTVKSRCSRGRAALLPLLAHLRAGEEEAEPTAGNPNPAQRVPLKPAEAAEPAQHRGELDSSKRPTAIEGGAGR